jgi:hypothetical protein
MNYYRKTKSQSSNMDSIVNKIDYFIYNWSFIQNILLFISINQ